MTDRTVILGVDSKIIEGLTKLSEGGETPCRTTPDAAIPVLSTDGAATGHPVPNVRSNAPVDVQSVDQGQALIDAELANEDQARVVELERENATEREQLAAIRESSQNLAVYAEDGLYFSLPMSGNHITVRDAISSLREELLNAAEHLNEVYRKLEATECKSKERFERIDRLTQQLAACEKDRDEALNDAERYWQAFHESQRAVELAAEGLLLSAEPFDKACTVLTAAIEKLNKVEYRKPDSRTEENP